VSVAESCPTCGQPDNCGDCTHGRLCDEVVRKGKRMTTWNDNTIQFPRLIDECQAVLTADQYEQLCVSMDLEMADLMELFDRAQQEWDRTKAAT
jgi:hypothetical protein